MKYLIVILFIINVISCRSKDKTIDVCSLNITDQSDKMELLNKYVSNNRGVTDAEYCISYQDNSGFPSGPSDWDMALALHLETDSISSWLTDMTLSTDSVTPIWMWDELQLDTNIWKLNTPFEVYKSNGGQTIKLVYTEEAIVLANYSTSVYY